MKEIQMAIQEPVKKAEAKEETKTVFTVKDFLETKAGEKHAVDKINKK